MAWLASMTVAKRRLQEAVLLTIILTRSLYVLALRPESFFALEIKKISSTTGTAEYRRS